MTLTLKVKRLTNTAKLPTYAHSESDRGVGGFWSIGK